LTEEKKIPVSGTDEAPPKSSEDSEEKEQEEREEEQVQPGNPETGSVEEDLNLTDVDMAEDQEVQDPVEQIEELEKKLKETHERLLRTAAELDNVRKRARRDVEEARQMGRADVLRDILPAIDSLDLALKSIDPQGKAAGIIDGVQMVRKQFLSATERFGLKPIASVAEPFDPNFHEAMAQINSDEIEAGNIVEEMRKGYVLGDRLLRASMVIVSKGPYEASGPKKEIETDKMYIPLTESNDINKEEGAEKTDRREENFQGEEAQGKDAREETPKEIKAEEAQTAGREEENE
jgi:molecular chaperone GrpE